MNSDIYTRLASPADAAGILAIYGPYVTNTSLTFETEIPSVTSMSARIASYLEEWPWLVVESAGKIAGYAYASRYRERTGYQWCVECSVYIHEDFWQKGVGSLLYSTLFRLLQLQGYRNVYAVINLPNEKSVSFHEKMGFKWIASYENVGYKLGKWKTVGWWQLTINPYSDEPAPPTPFRNVERSVINQIIEKSNKE